MASMAERRKQASERITALLEQAPKGVDKQAWLNDSLGLEDCLCAEQPPESEVV